MACSDSPDRMLWTAICSACMLDEHAVSTVNVGPEMLRKYDIRPARNAP